MELHITVCITINIPENKKIPIAQLTHGVHNQKIEKNIVQTAVQGIGRVKRLAKISLFESMSNTSHVWAGWRENDQFAHCKKFQTI